MPQATDMTGRIIDAALFLIGAAGWAMVWLLVLAWIVKDAPVEPSVINVPYIAHMKETPSGLVKPE